MSWIRKARTPHLCRKPILWPWIHVGSAWECDGCGQVWILDPCKCGNRRCLVWCEFTSWNRTHQRAVER